MLNAGVSAGVTAGVSAMLRCTTLTYGCLSLVATALQRMLCIGLLSPAAGSCQQCGHVVAGLGAVTHVQQLQNVAAAVLAVSVSWPVAAVSLPAAAPAQHQLHLHPGHKQASTQGTSANSVLVDETQASNHAAVLEVDECLDFKLQRTLFGALA